MLIGSKALEINLYKQQIGLYGQVKMNSFTFFKHKQCHRSACESPLKIK